MTTKKLLFLSDVHLGTDAPTNWYQRAIHEPLLLAIFEYVVAHAAEIEELVLLGDLVDQWTYLPQVRPPSLEEIAAAQPAIFAPGTGALARAHAALGGRMTFLPGNHDLSVTAARLSALIGVPILAGGTPIHAPAAARGLLGCTHGHLFSIYNAPDPVADPAGGLPLGHFIARLATLHASRQLAAGQTVADLPASGDPTGVGLLGDALEAIVQSFLTRDLSLARVTLETLLDALHETPALPFTMADGSTVTAAQVIERYAGLYGCWADEASHPRALYGRDPGLMALVDADARNSLAHFAGVLSARWPMVIMGHTHAPCDERDGWPLGSKAVYANAGFGCPSVPDLASKRDPKRVTFVEVELEPDGLCAAVRYLTTRGGQPVVAEAPLSPPRRVTLPRAA